MSWKRNVFYSALGASSVLVLSAGDVSAQCSGGGGGPRGMSTGSPTSLVSNFPYASNSLTSNYPSSSSLMANPYQQRVAQVQSQASTMAYQNEQRQRLSTLARDAQAMPFRMARAEAMRAARAERIAARLNQRDSGLPPSSRESYSLASVVAN
ncbi:hypothetical protein Poly51_44210 [Rubripirellula tenax]|uniref:Uncharacterized protein n=1 Tax=Rubripirellula tenax TaxID=2528015 RepID=A0A5C6ELP9_9BACT|nr:hypothetical protein [Rubripirellula tenax]TWU48521.1 hypothetical protein Poly51_44210 [Rubripirellula tenax]